MKGAKKVKFATASIAGTVEILAADEFVGVPITVTGTSVVQAAYDAWRR